MRRQPRRPEGPRPQPSAGNHRQGPLNLCVAGVGPGRQTAMPASLPLTGRGLRAPASPSAPGARPAPANPASSLQGAGLPCVPLEGGQAWGRRAGQAAPAPGEHRLARSGAVDTRTLALGPRTAPGPLPRPSEARVAAESGSCDSAEWASGAPWARGGPSPTGGGVQAKTPGVPPLPHLCPAPLQGTGTPSSLSRQCPQLGPQFGVQPWQGLGCLSHSHSPSPRPAKQAQPPHPHSLGLLT